MALAVMESGGGGGVGGSGRDGGGGMEGAMFVGRERRGLLPHPTPPPNGIRDAGGPALLRAWRAAESVHF